MDGERLDLAGDDLIITETPREGWAVTAESGLSVALDLEITPALQRAGIARDVVRVLQDARKTSGLDVTDRVDVRWSADRPETEQALREHGSVVAAEVLAVTFTQHAGAPDVQAPDARDADTAGSAPAGGDGHTAPDLGLTFWLSPADQAG